MKAREKIAKIKSQLALPAVVAPMFLVSGPDMVIAAIRAGMIGAFPAPNARDIHIFEDWLQRISAVANADEGREFKGSWAVNLVVHSTYPRLDEEVALLEKYRPPLVITALGSPEAIVERVQAYGGMVIAVPAFLTDFNVGSSRRWRGSLLAGTTLLHLDGPHGLGHRLDCWSDIQSWDSDVGQETDAPGTLEMG